MRLVASSFVLAAVALLAAFLPTAHAQPPETVLIQGQLLNDLGQPLTGMRGYRVRFFDAEVDGAQLGGDIGGQTILSPSGLFAIPLEPPAPVLEAPAAWYELAIDSSEDASGLTEADAFPERIRVHSVPFARVAGEALSIEVEAIGGGAVSTSEFESLAGIAGSVQSQLDTKAEAVAVDDALALKADAADVYTQTEVDDALAQKPDLAEVLPRKGESFVVVETTGDPVQNAANLQAAYAEAAALEPHGEALAENNRAVVIVPPGKYDLGSGQLEMDTPFVDLVGSTTARDNHHIFGTSNGANSGVLRQTADNVRIENLLIECTRASGGTPIIASTPAAYFPNGNLPNTVVSNCRFLADEMHAWSMRVAITYAGAYDRVLAGDAAFGGFGTASGIFTHCTGGRWAFGGFGTAAEGKFYYCVGGDDSFTTSGSPTVIFCVRNGVAYPAMP